MVVLLPPTSPPLCPPPSRAKTETFGEREFAKADGVLHVHVMTNVGVTVVYKSQISEPNAPANVDRTPCYLLRRLPGISIQILGQANQVGCTHAAAMGQKKNIRVMV